MEKLRSGDGGAKKDKYLDDNMRALEVKLTDEELI